MSEAKTNGSKRTVMAEQSPDVCIQNFNEVPLGYSPEEARTEASRCLKCKKPKCVEGCPVRVDIPGFIKLIEEGDVVRAAQKIKETNCLPAICGRVCPQESQCEALCILGKKGEPVAVGRLERFAADYEREHGKIELPRKVPPTGKKVAVMAGPGRADRGRRPGLAWPSGHDFRGLSQAWRGVDLWNPRVSAPKSHCRSRGRLPPALGRRSATKPGHRQFNRRG